MYHVLTVTRTTKQNYDGCDGTFQRDCTAQGCKVYNRDAGERVGEGGCRVLTGPAPAVGGGGKERARHHYDLASDLVYAQGRREETFSCGECLVRFKAGVVSADAPQACL